jgi:signal transduction histidine kinase
LERVGLVKALTRYVDIFERDTGITARCNISEAIPMLNGDLELAIYRVVQEALANTLKHSEASNVNISMGIHNNMIWTVIEDNGKGFDPENDLLIDNNHLGLAAMEERAHMLGGTLGIQSGPDCGTQITLLVPGVVFLQDSDKHYVSEKSAINNSI